MHKKVNIGAVNSAIVQRQRALDRYYKNPNKCKHCEKVIEVGEGQRVFEVRKKKFCNHECYRLSMTLPENLGIRRVRKPCGTWYYCRKKKPSTYNCSNCGIILGEHFKKYCLKCSVEVEGTSQTKIQIFSKCKNWQTARTMIRRHAAKVVKLHNVIKICKLCKYEKHAEIAHIKSVSSFPDEALLSEINSPDNLIPLCPNCHWEFDNGLIELSNT